MLACRHFTSKALMEEGVCMSACRHVGTLEGYKCKTRVGEGMYIMHVVYVYVVICSVYYCDPPPLLKIN